MTDPVDDGNVSKRINVTLPDAVAENLEKWANHEGRPTANLAAYLIEKAVENAIEQGKFPAPMPQSKTD